MSEITLPKICGAGLFDSTVVTTASESPNRVTTMYEIEFYGDDSGVSYIDGTSYKIRRGSVICVPPGKTRHSLLPLRSHYLHLSDCGGEICDIIGRMPEFFTTANLDKYIELVRKIAISYRFERHSGIFKTYALLFELLNLMYSDTGINTGDNLSGDGKTRLIVRSAMEYIDGHMRDKCSLRDISEHTNFSPVYFHNLFKATTGMTPYRYLMMRRMQTAKEFLTVSDKSVEEIADICGFESQSYFNYAFKKETGMTPGQYRKEAMNRYYG